MRPSCEMLNKAFMNDALKHPWAPGLTLKAFGTLYFIHFS